MVVCLSELARSQDHVEPNSLVKLLRVHSAPPHSASRPDPARRWMCLAYPRDAVVRPCAIEHHYRGPQPGDSIRDTLGKQLMPASRRQSCRACRREVLEWKPECADDTYGLGQRQEVRNQVRLRPTGVRDESRQVTHPRTVAADEEKGGTLMCRRPYRRGSCRLVRSNGFRRSDQLRKPMLVGLVTEPRPDRRECAPHDLLIGSAIGVQAAQHRRHLRRFGVDRGVTEKGTKVWWKDRRKTAGHRLQDVAPEGLDPGRVMEIDEEIQLSQELARINRAKRGHLP